jgi:hypothetical protein
MAHVGGLAEAAPFLFLLKGGLYEDFDAPWN